MPLIILGLLPNLLSARVLNTRQAVTCQFSVAASSGDTCTSFAADWGLTEAKFQALNPSVACPTTLVADQSYCVLGSVSSATTTSPISTTSTTTSPTSTTTSPTSTITSTFVTTTTSSSPYQPTQTGLASNCNGFYLVSSGDTCETIESKYGISSQEFASWNPAINSGLYYSRYKKMFSTINTFYRLFQPPIGLLCLCQRPRGDNHDQRQCHNDFISI